MTNAISLWLAIFIAAAVGIDIFFDLGGAVFLLRKLLDLIEWLSFWR
jgi:Na+/melibiose symporter-like transporter